MEDVTLKYKWIPNKPENKHRTVVSMFICKVLHEKDIKIDLL